MKQKANPRTGSTFGSFLEEEGILEEVTTAAMKRVLAWQVAELMREQKVSKMAMARRMRTSRAALGRLQDPHNGSLTLQTMGRAAIALGKRLSIEFSDAA